MDTNKKSQKERLKQKVLALWQTFIPNKINALIVGVLVGVAITIGLFAIFDFFEVSNRWNFFTYLAAASVLLLIWLYKTPMKLLKIAWENPWFRALLVISSALFGLFLAYEFYEFLKRFEGYDFNKFITSHPWSLLTGLAAAPALLLTWIWRDQAKRKDLEIAQESQLTDRFATAVKLLGDDKRDIRLGGIYALERLSKNSKADHWAIMETLSAFIRENAPWPPKDDKHKGKLPEDIKPETDIQAALTVIGRREDKRRQYEKKKGYKINLSGSDLRGANFVDAHLEGVEIWQAHLEGADLEEARLEGAILSLAHLERAYLGKAHLEGAELVQAHLEGAILNETHLDGAFLNEAHLEGANLSLDHLEGAYLLGSTYNSKTKDGIKPTIFPKNFNPKEHGMIDTSEPSEAEEETDTAESPTSPRT